MRQHEVGTLALALYALQLRTHHGALPRAYAVALLEHTVVRGGKSQLIVQPSCDEENSIIPDT